METAGCLTDAASLAFLWAEEYQYYSHSQRCDGLKIIGIGLNIHIYPVG
jgi:hypothetical protein